MMLFERGTPEEMRNRDFSNVTILEIVKTDKATKQPLAGTKFRVWKTMQKNYLVRYADDFVIVTNSRKHAVWWKQHIQKFL